MIKHKKVLLGSMLFLSALTLTNVYTKDSGGGSVARVETFFASWCGPCRNDIAVLNEFIRQHPGVSVVGYDEDKDTEKGTAFITSTGPDFPTQMDTSHEVAQSKGAADHTPVTIVYYSDGHSKIINRSLSMSDLN